MKYEVFLRQDQSNYSHVLQIGHCADEPLKCYKLNVACYFQEGGTIEKWEWHCAGGGRVKPKICVI